MGMLCQHETLVRRVLKIWLLLQQDRGLALQVRYDLGYNTIMYCNYTFLWNSFVFIVLKHPIGVWRKGFFPRTYCTILVLCQGIAEVQTKWIFVCVVKVKVKPSHYRPGQALRIPEGWGSQISRRLSHAGGKVVSPTHRPPLHPRKSSWYSFLLEAESTPGP